VTVYAYQQNASLFCKQVGECIIVSFRSFQLSPFSLIYIICHPFCDNYLKDETRLEELFSAILCTTFSHRRILVNGFGEARSEGPKGREARAEVGFLGRGLQAPSPPAIGSGERCKLPQRGPGRSAEKRFPRILNAQDDLSGQEHGLCVSSM